MMPIETRLGDRILATVRVRFAALSADQKKAEGLYRDLLARPREARFKGVEQDEELWSPALGHALLDRAERLFETDPLEAEHWACLASTIGDRLLAPWTLTEGEVLQGRARTLEGEALRRRGRIPEARVAQRRAFAHFEALPIGCKERADFCRYLSRLRRDQGRDDEALALLERALRRYETYDDRPRAQGCRLELAWLCLDDIETEEALKLFEVARLEEAGGRGGDEKGGETGPLPCDPTQWLALRQGLALAYADQRRDAEAWAILAEIAGGPPEPATIDPLLQKLAEASVLQRMDSNDEAAELLFAAWTGYALQGKPNEALLALLELGQLRAEQGSTQELERLKDGVMGLVGLEPNLREPVLLGLEFARGGGLVAVERLEAVKIFTQRARFDPEARFHLFRPGGGAPPGVPEE